MPLVFEATAVANASSEHVWEVLADFPNIDKYSSSVRESVSTSREPFAVGSTRTCRFKPFGTADERILAISPRKRLVIFLFNTRKLPIQESETVHELTAVDAGTTRLTMTVELRLKGGRIAEMLANRLRRRLPQAAQSIVDDLVAAAERLAQARGPG